MGFVFNMELLLVVCQYTCDSSDFTREKGGREGEWVELGVIYSYYIKNITPN